MKKMESLLRTGDISIEECLKILLETSVWSALTEAEKMQFEKARFADEQSRKANFELTGSVRQFL